MRFTLSFAASVYLGFAAAAVIPTMPPSSIAPTRTPDIDAHTVGSLPANLDKLSTSIPLPTSSVVPELSSVPAAGANLPVDRRANDLSDVLTSVGGVAGKGDGNDGGKGSKGDSSAMIRREDELEINPYADDSRPAASVPVSTVVPSASAVGRRLVDPIPSLPIPSTTLPTGSVETRVSLPTNVVGGTMAGYQSAAAL